jgi:hypothetical protein
MNLQDGSLRCSLPHHRKKRVAIDSPWMAPKRRNDFRFNWYSAHENNFRFALLLPLTL